MRSRTVLVALCVAGLAGTAEAQILTGSIIGTVRDESGAVLPGVSVTLASPALPAGPVTVVTNAQGEYRFTELDPGTYGLTLALAGFSTYQEDGLRVPLGGTIERLVTLKLATVAETITVSGESPMVDPRRVGTAANLQQEVLETSPVHRAYLTEYAKWSPGVSFVDPSGVQASTYSVLGSATNENVSLYDGIIADSPASGTTFPSSDHDAVEEIQVSMLGSSAEYPGAQGGVFNVVFKQGTNTFKGDASGFWYPDALISKPIKRPCNCPAGETGFTTVFQKNYSVHAGGPIITDRLWFYAGGNFDNKIQGFPGTDPEALKAANVFFYSHSGVGKITWQVTDKVKFKQSYEIDPYGGQLIPTLNRTIQTLTSAIAVVHMYASEVTATVSNNTLITARATGWFMGHNDTLPTVGDLVTPYRVDSLTGFACCGAQSIQRSGLGRHGGAFKINQYLQGARATHDLRAGLQFEFPYNDVSSALPGGVNYSDVGGRPDQASFRDPFVRGGRSETLGIWGEDQLTLGSKLTLSLGLRFDRMKAVSQDLPSIDNVLAETGGTVKGLGEMFVWNVVSPRLGFNLRLTDDGKMVMRGNYARGYRTILLGEFIDVHPGNTPITLARFNPATGAYSTIVSVTDPRANIAVDPDIEAPFSDQYSVGLDRELRANLGVGVTYVHKRGEGQVGWHDIGGVYGSRTEVLPDGRTLTVFPLLNAPSARRFLRTNGPGTFNRYNGLVLSMNKRWSNRWQGNLGYTLSKAEGLPTTGQDPNDDINAVGRLPLDRPHMFIAQGSYEIPRVALMLTGSFQVVQGTPFAPQALVQLPQGRRAINVEAPGSYRLPTQKPLSFRFSKILFRRGHRRLDLGAEVLNVLQDKAHDQLITQNLFSPTFGQAIRWVLPRRMIFVARADF